MRTARSPYRPITSSQGRHDDLERSGEFPGPKAVKRRLVFRASSWKNLLGVTMKHLIVCCDGTWNVPATRTNVHSLYEALAKTDSAGEPQLSYYVRGIGTGGGLVGKFGGGAVGLGLGKRMIDAYDWLARRYQHQDGNGESDRIWLFGFSRGAYTARNLAGLLTSYGLVSIPQGTRRGDRTLAEEVYEHYHQNRRRESVWRQFPDNPFARDVTVHFLGVWDTVGSLGIPDALGLISRFDPSKYRFYNTRLSNGIVHARHAVALDERRGPFAPTLWDADAWNVRNPAGAPGTTFQQVWFPGDYGSVGGADADKGLSDGALQWMMQQASDPHQRGSSADGLAFTRTANAPNALGPVSPPLTRFYRRLYPRPRAVPHLASAGAVDESARKRNAAGQYRQQIAFNASGKAVAQVAAGEAWNETGIWLTPGTYDLSAHGTWYDRALETDPLGTPVHSRLGILRRTANLAEWLQRALRKFTRTDNALAPAARRVLTDDAGQDVPRMCLVGVVADGEFDPLTELQQDHTTLKIGKSAEWEVFRDGYLYAFANDSWVRYTNNTGSITLSVQRLR